MATYGWTKNHPTYFSESACVAELFQTTKQNISLHTNNIFKEGELEKFSVVKEYLTTALDGKNYQTKYSKETEKCSTITIQVKKTSEIHCNTSNKRRHNPMTSQEKST